MCIFVKPLGRIGLSLLTSFFLHLLLICFIQPHAGGRASEERGQASVKGALKIVVLGQPTKVNSSAVPIESIRQSEQGAAENLKHLAEEINSQTAYGLFQSKEIAFLDVHDVTAPPTLSFLPTEIAQATFNDKRGEASFRIWVTEEGSVARYERLDSAIPKTNDYAQKIEGYIYSLKFNPAKVGRRNVPVVTEIIFSNDQ